MFRLFKPLFNNPKTNARLLVGSIFIHVLSLAATFYAILVFNRYLAHGLDSTLITLTVGAIIAMTLEYALRRLRFKMVTALCAKQERILAEASFKKMLTAPVALLQGLPLSERNAPTRAMEQVSLAINPMNTLSLMDAPFAVLFIIVLFLIAWPLGLVSLLFAIATLIGIYFHSIGLRETSNELQKAQTKHHALIASAERFDTVRVANAQPILTERSGNESGLWRLLRFRLSARQDRMQNFLQSMTALLSIIIIGVGAKLAIGQHIDIGSLFGASFLATRMIALILRPAQSTSIYLQGAQALEIVEKYLALPAETDSGTVLKKYTGQLEFKDVAFAFPGNPTPIFENLTLPITPGKVVIIAGSNGSGKTTFARIVAGLLEPTRGAIYADGVDLRQLRPSWWRQQIVYLPQEPELIDGTLHENLIMLAPETPDDWLAHILQIVGLKSHIDRHPQGINMPIIQGGRNLSLGIRRRVALARALVSEGRLVLIDEPTEGLDEAGHLMINQLLTELSKQGRTILVMTQVPGDLVKQATVIDLDFKPIPRITTPPATGGQA